MTRLDVVSENCACVDGQKSWHMLVMHDSHKQESYMYRLHEPLQYLSNIWIPPIILHAQAGSKNPLALGYHARLSLHTGKSKLPK